MPRENPAWIESNGIILASPEYDGFTINTTVLVMGDGNFVVDRRMPEGMSVYISRVFKCSGEFYSFDVVDTGLPGPSRDDLLKLERGYVYGRSMELMVGGEETPPCIDVVIGVRDQAREAAGEELYRSGRFRLYRSAPHPK